MFREYQGKYDISSSRKVKNALILYRRKKGTEEPANDLQDRYNELSMQYNMLLDVNADLKDALESSNAEVKKLGELVAKQENALNSAYKKLTAIKELLDEDSQV